MIAETEMANGKLSMNEALMHKSYSAGSSFEVVSTAGWTHRRKTELVGLARLGHVCWVARVAFSTGFPCACPPPPSP